MNKKNILLIIGSFIVAILCVIGFMKFINNDVRVYNDREMYSTYLENLRKSKDVHSGLLIFPNSINNLNILDFKYFERDGLFDGSYFFYLEVEYKDDFNTELERIKNLKVEYSDKVKYPIYEKYAFSNPVYITIFDGIDTYEYALINEEEKKITYIFNQIFSYYELGLNGELDPYSYVVPIDKRDYRKIGYNIYYDYDKFGNGKMYNE